MEKMGSLQKDGTTTLKTPFSRRRRRAFRVSLRPLLVLVVFLFVFFPVFVYNSLVVDRYLRTTRMQQVEAETLEHDSFFQKIHHHHQPLQKKENPCWNVSAHLLMDTKAIEPLREQCVVRRNDADDGLNGSLVVPNHVHFVYLSKEEAEFSFLEYAAVEAARRFLKPAKIFLHYVEQEPKGIWFTKCRSFLTLQRVDHAEEKQEKKKILSILLQALASHGGIGFLDFQTLTLRSMRNLRAFPALIGLQNANFAMNLQVLIAKEKSPFVKFLQEKLGTIKDEIVDVSVAKWTFEFQNVHFGQVVVGSSQVFTDGSDRNSTVSGVIEGAFAVHFPKEEEKVSNEQDAFEMNSLLGAVLRSVLGLNSTGQVS